MLSRDVCKRCMDNKQGHCWTVADNSAWSCGYIVCPRDGTFAERYTRNSGKPPKWCDHMLEHAMSEKKSIKA